MRYKVGMYGGSFNPLHMGHVDCILQAVVCAEQLIKGKVEIEHEL